MHLDPEQVERLLAGELGTQTERALRRHLAECEACRELVARADREATEVRGLLRQVDHPVPHIDAKRLIVRTEPHRTGWRRWAAGIVLVLASAGVLYATPGSPLPRWLAAAIEWLGPRVEPPDPAPPQPAPEPPSLAGIAVDPGRNLVIAFTAAQPSAQVRIQLTDGDEIVVRAPSGAATFTSHAARLEIDNRAEAATFEIQVPRGAPRVEIQVEGSRIFLKEAQRITTDDTTAQIAPYVLRLKP